MKNVQPVGGVPLVARTIRAASLATTVDVVVVSTDDAQIAAIAQGEGAVVIERPAEISGDEASSEAALLHALDALEQQGSHPDVLIFLQCTSPFTKPEDIDSCVRALMAAGADCAFTVVPTHVFVWREDASGDFVGVNHDHTEPRKRRQDLIPQYAETGAVYALDVASFRASGSRFGERVVGVSVDPSRAIEIDVPVDLEHARRLAASEQGNLDRLLPDPVDLVVLDFDGVLTDNKVMVDETGREMVRADRGDGYGIELLGRAGIPVVVLSREENPVIAARCRKLGIRHQQGIRDKLPAFRSLIDEHATTAERTIYVGNDVNDLECLRAAGCAVIVGDAHPGVHQYADIILSRPGGHGAVRELADAILRERKQTSG